MKLFFLFTICTFLTFSCSKVDIQTSINKAQALLKEQKFKEAEETLKPCLDAAKKNPRILVLYSLATSGQQKVDETMLRADEALVILEKMNSEDGIIDSEALTHIGQAYINVGKYSEAESILEQSLTLDTTNSYTAALLIEAELKQAKTLRKYALKNKHLKLAENFPELKNSINYLNLQAITNALGMNFDSRYVTSTLTKAYNKEKNNPAVLLNLAYIYDQVERIPGRAIKYYELYLTSVEILPAEHTQADKVKRRLTYLRSRN